MRLYCFITLLFLFLIVGCAGCVKNNFGMNECNTVSDVRQDIETFVGKEASICGYFKWEFEDENLYASESDAKVYSDDQCLSLARSVSLNNLSRFNNKHVRITGEVIKEFCPADSICQSSCSQYYGVGIAEIEQLK